MSSLCFCWQIDYKEVDSFHEFIEEAEKQFVSECKFNENLFNQFLVDTRHQVLSPDLRKWLRTSLLGKKDVSWDYVEEIFESNGPGHDYVDPHESFKVHHLLTIPSPSIGGTNASTTNSSDGP